MSSSERVVQNSLKPGKWVRSTCKMCLHSCTNLIHVTDDGVVNKIEGDPSNPSNNGKLCPKGNAAIMRHYDPQRFKQPMRRTNPNKGPGVDPKWEPISWDEAFDICAREIGKSLKEDPRKILPSLEDFQKMHIWTWPLSFGNFNCFQSAGTICGGAYHPANGYIHASFASINDVKYCNYWINDGTGDGFSSHLHAAASSYHMANARVDRGMKVVTVEPRLSISGAKSEEWVPIKPATDRQFALSLSHVLINEGLCDWKFLKQDTNAPYLVGEDGLFVRDQDGEIWVWDDKADKAKLWNDETIGDFALTGEFEVAGKRCKPAFQRFKDILDGCSPEEMEKITTVPPDTVRHIAREFAEAAQIGATIEIDGRTLPLRPAAYNYYRGAQGRKKGMQANHSYKLVNFLVGNIDAPGGHLGVNLDEKTIDWMRCEPGECGMMKGEPHQLGVVPPLSYPPNEYHLLSYFPVGVNPPHLNLSVWKDPEQFGMDYKPDVMVICHSNPLWAMQGPRAGWFDIMRNMRFIVCCDIIPTETTDFADVILPSSDVLETWNMTMIEPPFTEGQCLRQPAVEALYDTKSEEEIFYELSERLELVDSWNNVINMVLGFHQVPELMLEAGKKYSDKEIAERKGKLWNGKDLDWYIEHGHSSTWRQSKKAYRPWEGMRLLFYIEDMVTIREDLKVKMKEKGVPFIDQWPWDDYQPLPTPDLDPIHQEPPEYDLYGFFFKDIQMNFGESLSNPWIKDIVYRDPVHTSILLNSGTMQAKGLESGDIIRLESPHGGPIYGRVAGVETMHPDAVGVSNSLSRIRTENRAVRHAGGHFNDMLPYDLKNTDGVTGQPETACRVKITKVDDWPESLKQGGTVYQMVDEIAKGKGAH
ncbi:MAG: molybdopterin-dependent oxidoreductase [Candidatus Thiodiazotropha sp.]